jgi:hypothetical protein
MINPTYTLKSGEVLSLKKIKSLLVLRWQEHYASQHPAPEPPKKVLANGDEWYDQEDVVFTRKHGEYVIAQALSLWTWLFDLGVAVEVPGDWKPAFEDGRPRRGQYVLELCEDEAEIAALQDAIMSLTVATAKAVEAAEKN